MSITRKLIFSVLGLLSVFLIGTTGYTLIEGWSVVDSLYMTTITLSTVGFGEVRKLSLLGQFLTIGLILTAITIGAYAISNLTTYLIGGEIVQSIKDRRMEKRIGTMKKHHILAGFGKLGREIAHEIALSKSEFVIIELNPERVEQAREQGYKVIEGDASDEEILEKAGIRNAKTLIAALTGDPNNVMVTITAREMNQDLFIVARGIDSKSEAKLKRAGANRVELPFRISGRRISSLAVRKDFIEFIDLFSKTFSHDLNMDQFYVTNKSSIVNKTILECNIRSATGIIIMGIEHTNGSLIFHPEANTQLNLNDRLLVMGNEDQIEAFKSSFHLSRELPN